MQYVSDEVSQEAERRFIRLPVDIQARALLKGLSNEDDYVREACSERLSSFVGSSTEITTALMTALQDDNPRVRRNAASYFDIGILQTVSLTSIVPVEPATIIPVLQKALKAESNEYAKKTMERAVATMERLKGELPRDI
jgi:hypothetical protein